MVATEIVRSRENLRERFAFLVTAWKTERNGLSSDPSQWAMCLSYQKIIGMGPEIIPLILTELERSPDHWFWALHVLTDADPVKANHRGVFKFMVKDWLSWGRSRSQ